MSDDSEQADVEAIGQWTEEETNPDDWDHSNPNWHLDERRPVSQEDLEHHYWVNYQEHVATQTEPEDTENSAESGVQTDLYASVTIEDVSQLTSDLPSNFYELLQNRLTNLFFFFTSLYHPFPTILRRVSCCTASHSSAQHLTRRLTFSFICLLFTLFQNIP